MSRRSGKISTEARATRWQGFTNPTHLAILSVAVFLLVISFYFEFNRAGTPSDGARISVTGDVWTEGGVRVTPLDEGGLNLREGDIVIGVEGQPLIELVEGMLKFQPVNFEWSLGTEQTYTVIRNGSIREVAIPLKEFDFLSILQDGWGILLAGTINLIIFAAVFLKRSSYPPARALFLTSIGLFTTRVWAWGLSIPDLVQGSGFWIYQITTSVSYFLIFSGGLHFALTFPNRAPILKSRRWLIPVIYLFPNFTYWISFFFFRATSGGSLQWMNTFGLFTNLIPLAYIIGVLVAVIAGYRSNHNREHRAKVRWIAYAMGIVAVFGLLFYELPGFVLGESLISANELSVASLLVTADILIAIFRYQIFDIDIIINRTMVYSILSACLGIIYLGGVSLFGGILRSLGTPSPETSGGESPLTVVSSTLMVVVLFTPLRTRIQEVIDRRFFRTKYDAAQTLASLNRSMQEVVELEDLIGVINATVEETLQPEFTDFHIADEPAQRWGFSA